MTACSRGGGDSATTEAQETDSVAIQVKEPIKPLPDTCYSSADIIRFKIERCDTIVPSAIADLENLYDRNDLVLTFRKGPRRQADFHGRLDTVPTRIKVNWEFATDMDTRDTVYGPWYGGTGWTGQPLYVEWPDSLQRRLRATHAVNSGFQGRELIVASLCGRVYFLNPDNGRETRESIDVGNPIKGTPMFDPTFNGNLYVGQGTPAQRPFGALVIDLFNNKITSFFDRDPKALRSWGAYDSSPIRVGDFLFRPGENGSVYKFHIKDNGEIVLHTVLRYTVNGVAPGIEASMAVFANYGYVADNHGNIIAINLDTMTPVWRYTTGDDTDATPMILEENGVPFVYVGCEIDRTARGFAVFAKLNALDGQEVWRITPEGQRRDVGNKHFDGGFYASPLPGHGDCEDLIFTNMVKNTGNANGVFMAIDRRKGKVVYETPLKCYSWSSPVGFLTSDGRQIVVTADSLGNIYIIEGKTGRIINVQRIGANFESSPMVAGNSLYIGSRRNGIFKLTLE